MNYERIYNSIIQRAKTRKIKDYKEVHHVIPRFAGGNDSPENLVDLTAREHFICHWLLTKIYPSGQNHYKAIHSFAMMAWQHNEVTQCRYKCSSRVYEIAKKSYCSMRSIVMTENNHRSGKIWIHNPDIMKSKFIFSDDPIPEGWYKGRVLCFESFFAKKLESDRIKKEKERVETILKLHQEMSAKAEKTGRGYRKKLSDDVIILALKENAGDIKLAMASLGYSLKGQNTVARFKRLKSTIGH